MRSVILCESYVRIAKANRSLEDSWMELIKNTLNSSYLSHQRNRLRGQVPNISADGSDLRRIDSLKLKLKHWICHLTHPRRHLQDERKKERALRWRFTSKSRARTWGFRVHVSSDVTFRPGDALRHNTNEVVRKSRYTLRKLNGLTY